MVKTLLELIRQIYQLRSCNYNLTDQNIYNRKFKVCLEYHIGNCQGPCENHQSELDYNESVLQIRQILNGNLRQVIDILKKRMSESAINLKFEEADYIKQKIELLGKFQSKSTIVNPKLNNLDVFSFLDEKGSAIINFIKIANGAIVQSHTIELIKKLDESQNELLQFAIINLRNRFNSNAIEIIVPFKLDMDFKNIKVTIPQKGDKLKLLKLSLRNAAFYKIGKEKSEKKFEVRKQENKLIIQLKEDLRLKELPIHIECFDNSNVQGKFPVAACVVFINAKPKKSEYRHYNIKTVKGPNDYASMEEVVHRRYKRLLQEKKQLPQLIVIDGGKGQLNAALKSLSKLNLDNKIDVISVAKKLEKIFIKNDPLPLFIDKNSTSLKLIQHLRNEAHRFSITFHRNKRKKSLLKTELESVSGIGPITISKLLRHFQSIENIINAPLDKLERVTDKKRAALIWGYYHVGK